MIRKSARGKQSEKLGNSERNLWDVWRGERCGGERVGWDGWTQRQEKLRFPEIYRLV